MNSVVVAFEGGEDPASRARTGQGMTASGISAKAEAASADPTLAEGAEAYALSALETLGKRNWDLSLLFCGDDFIRRLNREYREKDEATDVLSFEQGESYKDECGIERLLAGDIVISLEALDRNALEFSVPRGEELRRLVLHGILHLSGMDHGDNDPSQPMLVLQERLLAELGPGKGAFS